MTSASYRRPERITVGIDGSLWAHAAVRWAIDHARPGDTITLVHARRASPSMVGTGLVEPTDDTAARSFAHHELARARALPRDETITLCCEVIHGDAHDWLAHHPAGLLRPPSRRPCPLIGATGAATFFIDYRVPFMLVGIGVNALGVSIAVRRLQRLRAHTPAGHAHRTGARP